MTNSMHCERKRKQEAKEKTEERNEESDRWQEKEGGDRKRREKISCIRMAKVLKGQERIKKNSAKGKYCA